MKQTFSEPFCSKSSNSPSGLPSSEELNLGLSTSKCNFYLKYNKMHGTTCIMIKP
jgi:hypothetical protein